MSRVVRRKKSERAKWHAQRENLVIFMIVCARKRPYMQAHGGAAHATMETKTYRPIPLCHEALTRRYYYWLLYYR